MFASCSTHSSRSSVSSSLKKSSLPLMGAPMAQGSLGYQVLLCTGVSSIDGTCPPGLTVPPGRNTAPEPSQPSAWPGADAKNLRVIQNLLLPHPHLHAHHKKGSQIYPFCPSPLPPLLSKLSPPLVWSHTTVPSLGGTQLLPATCSPRGSQEEGVRNTGLLMSLPT